AALAALVVAGARPGEEVRAHRALDVAKAPHRRHLSDHAFDASVDRAKDQNVPATVAGAPDTDLVAIDFWTGPGVADRVAVVVDLRPRVDLVPRTAVAGAEVAIVEHERGEANLREGCREAVQIHLLHGGKPVRHHHRRERRTTRIRRVQPAPQPRPLSLKLDVLSHPRSSSIRVKLPCVSKYRPLAGRKPSGLEVRPTSRFSARVAVGRTSFDRLA